MANILFYYPSNKKSVQIESTLIALKDLGHRIQFLTTCESGIIHQNLKKEGIEVHEHKIDSSNSITYYVKHIIYLIKFCNRQKIDIVFSNLQHVNFIAVIAQYLMNAKVIAFRHHFKFNKGHFGIPLQVNKNEQLFDRVINKLAKTIVVPSKGVLNGMLKHEHVNKNKVTQIPYLYDFTQYGEPDNNSVIQIRERFECDLLVIMVARLIPFKRHQLIFPVYKELIEKGYSIKVLILDEGPERVYLEEYVNENGLQESIFFLGFKKNLLDYMKASDLIIHPSITEASNNVIKEIGLMEKPAAICSGVGDFDEYIVHEQNGFIMDISNPQIEAKRILEYYSNQPDKLAKMGRNLRNTINSKFADNEPTLKKYQELIANHLS